MVVVRRPILTARLVFSHELWRHKSFSIRLFMFLDPAKMYM